MKTDDLITLLATRDEPPPQAKMGHQFARALGVGLPVAMVLMSSAFGIRQDLMDVVAQPIFWTKMGFALGLAWAGFVATRRLAQPGLVLGRTWAGLAAPLLLLWLGSAVWIYVQPQQHAQLLFGSTWRTCPLNIALISLPMFAATLWALKGLAPTRPALAGACAGVLAGALGALVYALHCPESSAAFVAIWYVLGIAIPTSAGALLGPKVLRW